MTQQDCTILVPRKDMLELVAEELRLSEEKDHSGFRGALWVRGEEGLFYESSRGLKQDSN